MAPIPTTTTATPPSGLTHGPHSPAPTTRARRGTRAVNPPAPGAERWLGAKLVAHGSWSIQRHRRERKGIKREKGNKRRQRAGREGAMTPLAGDLAQSLYIHAFAGLGTFWSLGGEYLCLVCLARNICLKSHTYELQKSRYRQTSPTRLFIIHLLPFRDQNATVSAGQVAGNFYTVFPPNLDIFLRNSTLSCWFAGVSRRYGANLWGVQSPCNHS